MNGVWIVASETGDVIESVSFSSLADANERYDRVFMQSEFDRLSKTKGMGDYYMLYSVEGKTALMLPEDPDKRMVVARELLGREMDARGYERVY